MLLRTGLRVSEYTSLRADAVVQIGAAPGTDLSRHSPGDLAAVAAALNGRPRKTLGWKTPAEALDEFLAACAA